MCGRYAAATTAADWVEEFEVTDGPDRVLAPLSLIHISEPTRH